MRAKEKLNIVYILSEKSSGSSFLFRSLADALNIKDYPETQHFESETLYWTKAASILEMPQLKMLASSRSGAVVSPILIIKPCSTPAEALNV